MIGKMSARPLGAGGIELGSGNIELWAGGIESDSRRKR